MQRALLQARGDAAEAPHRDPRRGHRPHVAAIHIFQTRIQSEVCSTLIELGVYAPFARRIDGRHEHKMLSYHAPFSQLIFRTSFRTLKIRERNWSASDLVS
jgi:hypothetical protein